MPNIYYIFSYVCILLICNRRCYSSEQQFMSKEERLLLREEARDMFYHAYNAYMENAYPADELMPLSCTGRFRGLTPNRGDIDDSLGNFSLTLIDTLDTLVILGDLEEFEHAVKLIIRDVSFDNDVIVSVFETNIRVVGGLLSGHILADFLQQRDGIMSWYKGELLDMAKDVGYRLLPAFNTTTGIPYSRVNLKYGIKGEKLESSRETCTACAGSMILEMAALSRLSGEPIFEEKAHKAMDELWKMRHRSSDLMGTVLNVHSGDWVRRDSGVGAGIDSYYEYCLKAYILLGDYKYLNRFNRHYNAVMKYISQGPMLLDVHMHRPHTTSRNYMDALLAFWPGLQVLKGDIKPAVETHEMLYQVMQRHKFIPEAFTTDFQVHWGNHPLRPEFLESTYFLYVATGDPYYLEVGKNVLKSLQKYARVPCGYAAVNDVRTGKKEDRMDSFVLAETFKYLYLLFTDKEDVILNLDEFIFTTEGHLLPLRLSEQNCGNATYEEKDLDAESVEFPDICPNTLKLFPDAVRKPLRNMVDGMCPKRNNKRKLTAAEFSAANVNHLKIIKDMGITIVALSDGRIQLLHSFSSARSIADAEEGLMFMQEMVELSKIQSQQPEPSPQSVSFLARNHKTGNMQVYTIKAGPSQFGIHLKGDKQIKGRTITVQPIRACEELKEAEHIKGKIAIMERGDCMFVDKVRRAQKHGAIAAIIIDNNPSSSSIGSQLFSMSGDGNDDVKIPAVFLFRQDANSLLTALLQEPFLEVTISELKNPESWSQNEEESMFQKLKMSVQDFLNKHTGIAFTKTVEVGGFKANIDTDRIRITHVNDKKLEIPDDKEINNQWRPIRRKLLESILKSDGKELHVPLNILTIYYQTLSGASAEDLKSQDVVRQTQWLLNEIYKEYNKKDDDSLVQAEEIDTSVLTGVSKVEIFKDKLLKTKKKLEKLNTILESVSHLESDTFDDIVQKLTVRYSDDVSISDKIQSDDTNPTFKENIVKDSDKDIENVKRKHQIDEL